MINLNLRDLAFLAHQTAPPSTLLTGLTAYWKLDEPSGTRFDSVGSSHWTGDLGSVPGIIGNAVACDGTNELDQAVSPAMSLDFQDWTIGFWFKTSAQARGIIFLFDGNSAYDEAAWLSIGIDSGAFYVDIEIAEQGPMLELTDPTPDHTRWHLALIWHEVATPKICLQIDNATPVEATAAIQFSAASGWWTLGLATPDCLIDELALWKRLLPPSERTDLWNSGAGRAYPF